MKTGELTVAAVMTALICIAGPMSIQIGPVPLSLATFAVYMAGAVLGAKQGTVAVVVYLLLGTIGIPVFSGFSGGFQKLAGMTGGYLIGYIPCALLTGLGTKQKNSSRRDGRMLPLMMAAGTMVLYLVGTAWFMIQTGNGITASLSMCVLPFLPGDAMKIIAASLLAGPVRKAIARRS